MINKMCTLKMMFEGGGNISVTVLLSRNCWDSLSIKCLQSDKSTNRHTIITHIQEHTHERICMNAAKLTVGLTPSLAQQCHEYAEPPTDHSIT